MHDNEARMNLIKQRLSSLQPEQIRIEDESAMHAGHAGAASGGGHFELEVVSQQFIGKSAIERHRMIFSALGDAMGTEIHALSIKAKTPAEATKSTA